MTAVGADHDLAEDGSPAPRPGPAATAHPVPPQQAAQRPAPDPGGAGPIGSADDVARASQRVWQLGGAPVERHWLVVGSLWFRALATPVPVVALVVDRADATSLGYLAVAGVMSVWSIAGGLAITPQRLASRRFVTVAFAVDATVVVAVNLGSALVADMALTDRYYAVFWPLAQSSAIIVFGLYGVRGTVLAVALGTGLFTTMLAIDGMTPRSAWLSETAVHALWLALAAACAIVARALLTSRATIALTAGMNAGREAEKVRNLRHVHDTALQSLDGIAMLADSPSLSDADFRRLVGRTARDEARQLRGLLQPLSARDLTSDVASITRSAGVTGVPVQFRYATDGPVVVPAEVHDAVCGAVREALTNVRQHAHASRVDVRLAAGRAGLTVEVQDDGVGFDPTKDTDGFGVVQSIRARTEEVGGRALVRSAPDQGSLVRLSFPREVTTASGWRFSLAERSFATDVPEAVP